MESDPIRGGLGGGDLIRGGHGESDPIRGGLGGSDLIKG